MFNSSRIVVRHVSIVGWKRLTRSLLEILLCWTYFTSISVGYANTATELYTQVYNFVPRLQIIDDLVHLSRDFRGGLYTKVYKNVKYRKVIFGTNPLQIAVGAKCPWGTSTFLYTLGVQLCKVLRSWSSTAFCVILPEYGALEHSVLRHPKNESVVGAPHTQHIRCTHLLGKIGLVYSCYSIYIYMYYVKVRYDLTCHANEISLWHHNVVCYSINNLHQLDLLMII